MCVCGQYIKEALKCFKHDYLSFLSIFQVTIINVISMFWRTRQLNSFIIKIYNFRQKSEMPSEFNESILFAILDVFSRIVLKLLHSAVSNPQDCSRRFTLYFPDRPVESDTISTSLGSIQPYAAKASRTHIHQCLQPDTQLYS